MNFETFSEGYKSALINVEKQMEASINRGGTPVTILNDMIVYIHQEMQSVAGIEVEEEEEAHVEYDFDDVNRLVDTILKDLTQALNTKGGVN